ncbi:hypothetical protein HK405_003853 [Cladochytrium tenue]|nr:hypothetical protein HK405_003853 [Cladochytrium tenue]
MAPTADPAGPSSAAPAELFGVKTAYPYLQTPRRLRWVRWALWWLVFLVVTVVACWLLARYYSRALDKQQNKSKGVGDGTGDFTVEFVPLKFDVSSSTLTVLFTPEDATTEADVLGRARNTTTFYVGGSPASKTFATGAVLTPFTVVYAVPADTSVYPFDAYALNFTIFALYANGDQATLDLDVNLETALPSFQYEDAVPYSLPDFNVLGFSFAFRRSGLTIALTVFTWVLMHLWTVMVVFLAAQCIFRERPAYPFMVWAAASIFSMSTIRGIQPSAPVVGTYYDMGTYVWAVVISCVAAFALFVVSFHKHKPESEKDKLLKKKEKEFKFRKFIREETALTAEAEAKAAAEAPAASYVNSSYMPLSYQR